MRYRRRKDGTAIKIKITAGKIVQAISIICPSSRNGLIF
jgi:hypothetical protein